MMTETDWVPPYNNSGWDAYHERIFWESAPYLQEPGPVSPPSKKQMKVFNEWAEKSDA